MNNFFQFIEAIYGLAREFFKARMKQALNSFLAGKLLTHDFGLAIVFISVNSEIKCNSIDVSKEHNASSFFGISKSTLRNVWY